MSELISIEVITSKILVIREQKVMLDRDLAKLYGVETRILNQAVRRNIKRFPEDFMFQLTKQEFNNWKSQFVISNADKMGLRKLPYAFTELGVAMLSSVLKSEKAVEVNIQIMRAFVKFRKMMLSNKKLRARIDAMEQKYDKQFKVVFDALRSILETPKSKIKKIGFKK